VKARHARELVSEAEQSGVRVVKSGRIPLHGKFLTWDEDDIVITSVNWASASSDPDFPEGEVGVHIRAAEVAAPFLARLSTIHPNLLDQGGAGDTT
jgi:cardiolipin synthase